jgi:hypothetical protein
VVLPEEEDWPVLDEDWIDQHLKRYGARESAI